VELLFLLVVCALAGTYAWLNGFRDASFAVAVAVRTRSLTPSVALLLAGLFTLTGALCSLPLALALSRHLIGVPAGSPGLALLGTGLAGACACGLHQWWRGLPSSSTHALIGGLAGASGAAFLVGQSRPTGVDTSLLALVVLPLVISPLVAFLLSFVLVYPAVWAARHAPPRTVHERVRQLQAVASAAVAFGHGLQDGQRTTTVLLLALGAAGLAGTETNWWAPAFGAVLLTAGTLAGGWRISYTVGTRLVRMDPMRGVVAQLVTSVLLLVGAIGLQLPLSTAHTTTSAVVGAGVNQDSPRADRLLWLRILGAWLVTPIAAAVLAGILFLAVSPLL
jgi:PiT family inorganic phosphate transporter